MTENERLIDLLTEFDEMGFVPTTTVPNAEVYAIKWRDQMTQAITGYRSEVAREIFEKLLKTVSQKMPTKLLLVIHQKGYDDGVVQGKREAFFDIIEVVSELKKKYGGTTDNGERADRKTIRELMEGTDNG